jgi:hypothetical protein
MSWACGAPLIPALGIRRQEDQEFEASLGYIVSSRPAWAIKQDLVYKKKGKMVDILPACSVQGSRAHVQTRKTAGTNTSGHDQFSITMKQVHSSLKEASQSILVTLAVSS